jgi:hypothetical protein
VAILLVPLLFKFAVLFIPGQPFSKRGPSNEIESISVSPYIPKMMILDRAKFSSQDRIEIARWTIDVQSGPEWNKCHKGRERTVHERNRPQRDLNDGNACHENQAINVYLRLNQYQCRYRMCPKSITDDQLSNQQIKRIEIRMIIDSIGCLMNSWVSDCGIVSQLSRLEHRISLKESNLLSEWEKLK